METGVSVVIEDFEVGDRAYLLTGFRVQTGTVHSADSRIMGIVMDDGTAKGFTAQDVLDFQLKDHRVGKPLNLELVYEGCTISQDLDTERIYAEVETYIPGKELAFRVHGHKITTVIQETQFGQTLEVQMILWEVEA